MQRAKAAASFAQIAAWLIWPSWDERIWAGIWAHKHRRDGPGNAMSGKMRACQIFTLVFVVHHKKPFFARFFAYLAPWSLTPFRQGLLELGVNICEAIAVHEGCRNPMRFFRRHGLLHGPDMDTMESFSRVVGFSEVRQSYRLFASVACFIGIFIPHL